MKAGQAESCLGCVDAGTCYTGCFVFETLYRKFLRWQIRLQKFIEHRSVAHAFVAAILSTDDPENLVFYLLQVIYSAMTIMN